MGTDLAARENKQAGNDDPSSLVASNGTRYNAPNLLELPHTASTRSREVPDMNREMTLHTNVTPSDDENKMEAIRETKIGLRT